MKPKYILFYKSDEKLNELLSQNPFNFENSIHKKTGKNESIYEYEHFDLYCFKKQQIGDNMCGHKAWTVIVDREFKSQSNWNDVYNCILQPMISIYGVLGNIQYI